MIIIMIGFDRYFSIFWFEIHSDIKLFVYFSIFDIIPCSLVWRFVEVLLLLLDNNCIWFGTKLYQQILDIPNGTNCARVPYCRSVSVLLWEILCCPFLINIADIQRPDVVVFFIIPLRKQTYSNILRILPPKNENFQMKNSSGFQISAQNINCGYLLEPPRRGGSNEYPQSMVLSRNKKINVYPFKPQFYCIKVEFKGAKSV